MTKFGRFDLRTTDVEAARAFYTRLFGHERAVIWPLHEQALARGARPHWLGHLGVANPEQSAADFIARGATRLGPARATEDGGAAMVLRDPGGALVALSTPPGWNTPSSTWLGTSSTRAMPSRRAQTIASCSAGKQWRPKS